MPRKTKKTVRTLKEIFEQSEKFGAENVMLNDAETGAVWTGGAKPLDAATIANKRYRGDFNVPVIRGANREPLSRLSDVLAFRGRQHRAVA